MPTTYYHINITLRIQKIIIFNKQMHSCWKVCKNQQQQKCMKNLLKCFRFFSFTAQDLTINVFIDLFGSNFKWRFILFWKVAGESEWVESFAWKIVENNLSKCTSTFSHAFFAITTEQNEKKKKKYIPSDWLFERKKKSEIKVENDEKQMTIPLHRLEILIHFNVWAHLNKIC